MDDRAPVPVSRITSALQTQVAPIYDNGGIPLVHSDDGIFRRIRRRKLLFATAFVAVLGLVGLVFALQTPTYRATASVVVAQHERLAVSQGAEDSVSTVGDIADLESQGILIGSPANLRVMIQDPKVRDMVAEQCAIRNAQPLSKLVSALSGQRFRSCADESEDTLITNLQQQLSIGVNGRSRVIDITCTSPLPEVAKALADKVAETYLQLELRNKLSPRDNAIAWLTGQSKMVSDRLKATELSIQTFLQSQGVMNGDRSSIASEELSNLSRLLAQAEAELAAASGRRQQNASGRSSASVLDNRAINDLKLQLATATSRLQQASSDYGPAAPQFIRLKQQQQALQSALDRETSTVVQGLTTEYQAANDRVQDLRRQVDQLKQNVRLSDSASIQVSTLQRDAAADRNLYIELTQSLNRLETDRRLVVTNARLVNLAEVPQKVFFPKLSTFALAGGVLAVTLASLLATIRDRTDATLRSVGPLVQRAQIRLLSNMPDVSGLGVGVKKIARRMKTSPRYQEALRVLFAECLLLSPRQERKSKSLLVSSAVAGEGKTSLTLNFGRFAAEAGLRVLLIEADLRRPSFARRLGLPRGNLGLVNVLYGEMSPHQACHKVSRGLDVIVAGEPTMASTELLNHPATRSLLAWANQNYDLVLIDTPGSRLLPDARILASLVDEVIYCARWGHSSTEIVAAGIAEMRASGGYMSGLVVNQVSESQYQHYDRQSFRAGSYAVMSR